MKVRVDRHGFITLRQAALTLALSVLATAPAIAKESSSIRGEMDVSGVDADASAKVKFSLRATGAKLQVKGRGLEANSQFELRSNGLTRATATSSSSGALRFDLRTDDNGLDFDPRGELLEVHNGADDVLSMVFSGTGEPSTLRVSEATQLVPTGLVAGASGNARFRSDKGVLSFRVEIEDVPAGSYDVYVAGLSRTTLVVDATGKAEVEFRDPIESGKILLDFDPRGQTIDIVSTAGVVLSATMLAQAPGVTTCSESELQIALASTGADPDGSGHARLRTRDDCEKDFSVEIEDVPAGSYDVIVGGTVRGSIVVVDTGIAVKGEIEFDTNSDDPGELPLDFDPLGATLEVAQGATVFFSSTFTGTPGTPTGCVQSDTRLPLLNGGSIASAKGDVRVRERDDCSLDLRVEIEDVPVGNYDLVVGGSVRGSITVALVAGEPQGEIEFASDPQGTELLLDFDPFAPIEVKQGATVVLSRDLTGGSAGGGSGGSGGSDGSCSYVEIAPDLNNLGVIGSAKGDARFRERIDCQQDFRVQIEDVPVGNYDLVVGGTVRGTIAVVTVSGNNQGQIEFDSQPSSGEIPLEFDPRGQTLEVKQGATAVLSVAFPAS